MSPNRWILGLATALFITQALSAQTAATSGITGAADGTGGATAQPQLPLRRQAPPAPAASLTWVSPKSGARFTAPAQVELVCTAVDPAGDIRLVEFFANGRSIGRSEHLTRDAVIPNRPRQHIFVWTAVEVGDYSIVARAKDTLGKPVESVALRLVVTALTSPPKVQVRAMRAIASEFGDSRSRLLSFGFTRSDPADFALPVFYTVAGTAKNGVDYEQLSGTLTLPAGKDFVELLVPVLGDNIPEGDESVIITVSAPVCPAIVPPPKECYIVGDSAEAKGVIRDDDLPANQKPTVSVVEPEPNETFTVGDTIAIVVRGTDPDGYLTHVAFLVDGRVIGEESIQFLVPPPPGQKQEFKWAWRDATAGRHTLSARVTDDRGATQTSESQRFTVEAAAPRTLTWVKRGSLWKFHADNQDLGTTWRDSAFNDQAWKTGNAPLGFGNVDDATILPNPDPRQPTVYFRHSFTVAATEGLTSLLVRLQRDDGAVVYLNGKELVRDTMPKGAIQFSTLASEATSGDEETTWVEHRVPAEGLVTGANTLAVEVHQYRLDSSDLRLDLEFVGQFKPTETIPTVSLTATVPETREPCPPFTACTKEFVPDGKFTLRRSAPFHGALPVFFRLAGTALPGVDYRSLPRFALIPDGQESVDLLIEPNADLLVEGDETVEAHLVVTSGDDRVSIDSYRIDPAHASAKLLLRDRPPGNTAGILLQAPVTGQSFTVGEGITLHALTYDPAGAITTMEFFAGETRIGESTIFFIQKPPNGSLINHEFRWLDAPVGTHVLTGRAKDAQGNGVVSDKITIQVVAAPPVPAVVSLRATQPVTSEPCPTCRVAPGVLTLTRTGSTGQALTVALRYSGSAERGVDYESQPDAVTIPAGQASIDWPIVAFMDFLAEGTETVVVEILPDASAGPIPRYTVQPRESSARVAIQDQRHDLPVVSLRPEIKETTEPLDNGRRSRPAAFTLHRTGSVQTALGVFLSVAGTAQPASDYVALSPWIEIPAGRASVTVALTALGDFVKEGDETILVNLGPWILGRLPDYQIDASAHSAAFVIHNAPRAAAQGSLSILSPEDGDRFQPGAALAVLIEAIDPKDCLCSVELLANDVRVGESSIVFDAAAPLNGRALVHKISWTPRESAYRLVARGKDSLGKVITSLPVDLRPEQTPPNRPPKVELTQPRGGTVFDAGQDISIVAEAKDSDGTIARLEILADTVVVASGPESKLTFRWSNASPGRHSLAARAVDNLGAASMSASVTILVRTVAAGSFVQRKLPAVYVPGTPFEVQLEAEPATTASAYTVEDRPPRGWTVARISGEGIWDASQGTVKFGPYLDATKRSLTYLVTPTAPALNPARFGGEATIDGRTYLIGGASTVALGDTAHPADHPPANFALDAGELTAYAAAWKLGQAWPRPPSPIPADFVTSAGRLWRAGENYLYVPEKGAPPECWIPASVRAAATLASVGAPRQGPPQRRFEPGPNGRLHVTLQLPALPESSVAVLEERLPSGWNPSGLSHEGVYDAAASTLRWGPFFGSPPPELSYQLEPGSSEARLTRVAGVWSVDGHSVAVAAAEAMVGGRGQVWLQVNQIERIADRLRFRLPDQDLGDQLIAIESSDDLIRWTAHAVRFLPDDGLIEIDDPATPRAAKFYRLRLREE